MSASTPRRLSWMMIPLAMVAWMAAPEWPARAGMMDSPARDFWLPVATAWAETHPVPQQVGRPDLPPPPDGIIEIVEPPAASSAPAPVATSPSPPEAHPATPSTASVATSTAQVPTQVATAAVQHSSAESGTVLMIGDSLMGEVAAGLRQNLPRRYTVVDRHKSSTGLTNLAYYDWPGTAQAAAADTHPTWVVIHMGANDAQDMLVGGHWIHFGSAEWRANYLARAQSMIDRVRTAAPGVTLVWVGLPAMRADAFDAKMEVIRGVQAQAAASRQVPYLDGHAALGPTYAKDGDVGKGKRQILRADDGIHYSRTGGTQLAREAALSPTLGLPWGAP